MLLGVDRWFGYRLLFCEVKAIAAVGMLDEQKASLHFPSVRGSRPPGVGGGARGGSAKARKFRQPIFAWNNSGKIMRNEKQQVKNNEERREASEGMISEAP